MRKLLRQVTIVAFTSLALISASLADNTKAQHYIKAHSTKAHPAKAHLAASSADKAQRSTKAHRLVIQVDQNDPAVMNLALNNATNVIDYYRAKGEDVNVDVVTYGPGLHMLRADTSPVQDRIKSLKDYAFPSKVQFSACGNTKEGMEKKEGHPITVLSEAVIVPSGVVRLMELQEKGWSYVRP
jgi:intracellular sulfur oxidation DsrE/DsrF family protein